MKKPQPVAAYELPAPRERRCRVCGCTEQDCRECIEKTGAPCSWVEEDLCSACALELAGAEQESESMKNGVQTLPLAQIAEPKSNPRRHFDEHAMAELTESVKLHGVLQPVLARPKGKGYELVAGNRRYRAAKAAGIEEIPAVVRELEDRQVLEIQIAENLQRTDLHPLEEAEGYRRLHEEFKLSVEDLAAKVGKSVAYVYARMKLCALTDEAKKLFLEDRMTPGHAILLARLKPEDQARAIDPDNFALFDHEASLFLDGEEDESEYAGFKPRSVREFQGWIDKHVHFDLADVDQMVFPETAAALEEAEEQEEKVIPITRDYVIAPDARTGVKVLTERSWKRADGEDGSKPCEFAAMGVVVVGRGRGEAFKVCTAKKKCKTHWGDEIRAKAKQEKKAAAGGKKRRDSFKEDEERRAREHKNRELARRRWQKSIPAINQAIAERVKAMPTKANGLLADIVVDRVRGYGTSPKQIERFVPRGDTAEDLVRYAAFCVLFAEIENSWAAVDNFPKRAKAFGIDVKKILDEVAPEEKPAAAEKKGATKEEGREEGVKAAKKAKRKASKRK